MSIKNIALLGSTGSIGTQTLEIVRNNKDRFKVVSLSANSSVDLMEKQAREFNPLMVAMYDEVAAKDLKERLADTDIKIVSGMAGLIEACTIKGTDLCVTGIVGMIGIQPTIAAINAGIDIALANKETLVCAGHIIMPLAKEMGVNILPVDSEHSAIFQSMQGFKHTEIERIYLTASGGPFIGKTKDELKNVSVEQALNHPNWSMGKKVTIDSASLCNKGLEIMEAAWLFNKSVDDILVLIHPQSILHSGVEYKDGALMAQLGVPDMKLPIQYAMTYPDRIVLNERRLDLFELNALTFIKPDEDTFMGLKLARMAAKAGGSMPTVFNAANEVAVREFLAGNISFLGIYEIINKAMDAHKVIDKPSVEQILEVQKWVIDNA